MADFVQQPAIQALAWALVHFLWQGAAIGLAAFIAFRAVRTSPSLRYAIGVGAMVAMIAAPLTTFLVLSDEPVPPASVAAAPDVRITLAPALQVESSTDSASSAAATLRIAPQALAVAVAAWLVGVACFAIRLMGGWLVARRLARRAVQPASEQIQAVARQLADRLAITRGVAILQSSAVAVPVMVGWLRPAIILPMAALAGLSPSQMEALLAHELAHVRRHDYLVNLLQAVAEALLFYHPVVWWLSRRVRAERELCCDDLAVSVCDPLVYATALTDLAAMNSPGLALAATDGDLLGRVRRILGQSDAAPSVRAGAMPVLALVLVAGVAVPVVLASTQTPVVRPSQVIEVAPDPPAPVVTLEGGALAEVPAEAGQSVVLEADRVTLQQMAPQQTAQQQAEQQRAEELKRKVEELQAQQVLLARERASAESQRANELSQKARELEVAAAMLKLAEAKRQFDVGLVSDAQVKDAQAAVARAKASGNPQALQVVELQIAKEKFARSRDLVDKGLMSASDLANQEEQIKLLELRVQQGGALGERSSTDANNARALYELLAGRRSEINGQQIENERLLRELRARVERFKVDAEVVREVATEGQPVAANEPVKAGDDLRITIQGESDLRTSYRVSDEGTIRLPLLGAIKVVGLTAAQVREAVGKQLAAHKLGTVEQVTVTVRRVSRAG